MKHGYRQGGRKTGPFRGGRKAEGDQGFRPRRKPAGGQSSDDRPRREGQEPRRESFRQDSEAPTPPRREGRPFNRDDRKPRSEGRSFDRDGKRPAKPWQKKRSLQRDGEEPRREERPFKRDDRKPHSETRSFGERKPRFEGRKFDRDGPRDGQRARKPWDDRGPKREGQGPRKDFKNRRDDSRRDKNAPRRDYERADRGGVAIWGVHAVREAWLNPKRQALRLWVTENALDAFADTVQKAKDLGLTRPDPKKAERAELDRLLPPGSVHQGIVMDVEPLIEPALHEVIAGDAPPDLLILLDQVTDPHNVGAIARSAAALGAGAVVLTERNAPGLTGVLAKAASGAIDHVPLVAVVNLARAIEELQEAGYWCVGLAEEGARPLSECDLSGRTALVLGAEGEGLRHLTRQKCHELARLPTGGPIGSLNVSNAAAVALYEVRRQKGKFV